MNRYHLLLAAVIGGSWLGVATGAVPLSYIWADGGFNISTGDLSTTQPHSGAWQGAFATAAGRWNDSTIVTVTTDNAVQTADCSTSGPNTTFFMSTFCGTTWGSSTLATARTLFFTSGPQAGEADHTDIVFKSSVDWVVDDGQPSGSDTDFTRVAVHELGHSLGLDHTPDSSAIMYFLSGDTIGPQSDDAFGLNRFYGAEVDQVIVLDDIGGSGWDDLGVVLLEDDGDFVLHVRDGKKDTKLKKLNLGRRPLISIAAAPDATGNGVQEVVALTQQANGAYKLRVFDLDTKALVSQRQLSANIRWVDVIAIADTDGGGLPDMVPIGLNGSGKVKAQIYDIATAAKIRNVNFGSADEVVVLLELADTTGDLVPELVALVRNASGVAVARVRSGANGSTIVNHSFGSAYAPLGLAIGQDMDGNGSPELIELGQNDGGEVRVMRQDLSAAGSNTKTFLGASNIPRGVVALDDVNQDGVPDYGAVIEKDNAEPRLRVLDGVTGVPFKTMFFNGIGEAQDVLTIDDQNGSGNSETVVLGDLDGTFRTQMRDPRSGNELNTTAFP